MNSRMITTVGIVSAIMLITAGAGLAFARGGGGGGPRNGNGSGGYGGAGMSQNRMTYQQQYRQQDQKQSKQQNQNQYRQDKGFANSGAKNGQLQGDQLQLRTRDQIRDPASHEVEGSE